MSIRIAMQTDRDPSSTEPAPMPKPDVASVGFVVRTVALFVPQDAEQYAFAVADADSYYLFVVNEDEATPMELELDLSALSGVVPGSSVVTCLIADGCAAFYPLLLGAC